MTGQTGGTGRRWWRWTIGVSATLLIVAIAISVVLRTLADAETIDPPVVPPVVEDTLPAWGYRLYLPAELPPCVEYAPDGADVQTSPAASGGAVLRIAFALRDGATGCNGPDPEIEMLQAPALRSLDGTVTTVSRDQIHYARQAQPVDGGQRLTFQWLCGPMTCRLSGTIWDGGSVSEEDLLRIATSTQLARS